MIWYLLIAAILAGAAGAVLLLVGVLGRTEGGARHCRHCLFDLTGVVLDVCPECGRSLSGRRAVRQGLRMKRRGLTCAGGVLSGLGLLLGATLLLILFRTTDPIVYTPTWLLVGQLESMDPYTVVSAAEELLKRQSRGELSDADRQRLLAVALTLRKPSQVTTGPLPPNTVVVLGATAWDRDLQGLDRLVLEEFLAGNVSREKFQAYLRNIAEPVLVQAYWLDSPWAGDDVIFDADLKWRLSAAMSSEIAALARLTLELDTFSGEPRDPILIDLPIRSTSSEIHALRIVADRVPGQYRARGRVWLQFDDVMLFQRTGGRLPSPQTSAPAVDFPVHLDYVVVPAGTGLPPLFTDGAVGAQIREALQPIRASHGIPGFRPHSLNVGTTPMPHGISFEVLWRLGDQEWPVGHLTAVPGAPATYRAHRGGEGVPDADVADIVLRTNPLYIKELRHGFERLWDGEIVFEGVTVHRRP